MSAIRVISTVLLEVGHDLWFAFFSLLTVDEFIVVFSVWTWDRVCVLFSFSFSSSSSSNLIDTVRLSESIICKMMKNLICSGLSLNYDGAPVNPSRFLEYESASFVIELMLILSLNALFTPSTTSLSSMASA